MNKLRSYSLFRVGNRKVANDVSTTEGATAHSPQFLKINIAVYPSALAAERK